MDPGRGPGDENIDPAERHRLNEAHFHNILQLINQERQLMGFQFFQANGFREQDPFNPRPVPFPENVVVPQQQGVLPAGHVQEQPVQQPQPAPHPLMNEINRVWFQPHRFWNQENDLVDRLMQRGGLMGMPVQPGEEPVDEEVARQRRAAHRQEQMDRFERHFRRNNGHQDPGSDDEDGTATPGFPRDFDIVDYLPAYIARAHEDRLKKFACPLCNQDSFNIHFLEHLKICAAEVEASFDEEEKALALFNSSEYTVRQSLARLRERCEVSYLCAMSDPALRVQMACEKCHELQDHLDGQCMDDNQKAVFRAEGERIINKALREYSDYMELEIKVEVDRITDKYTAAYERDTVRPLDQPINLEIEHERQQVLETMRSDPAGPESIEKETMKAKLVENHARDFETVRNHLRQLVKKQGRRMVKYIIRHKNHQLRDVIAEFRQENNFEAVTGKRYAIVKKLEIGLDGEHVSRWTLFNPV
ncbi:hypothetical protein CRE_15378 [Caenorhabditis remanei]|uniref:Uncharacterized protein n=1 Tax=Caenorhabditis remanei TaxID=31234 RepID=E3MC09_CAERE|nr:hypothetical protein CRE_15378 [Caenorhabditis remanei]